MKEQSDSIIEEYQNQQKVISNWCVDPRVRLNESSFSQPLAVMSYSNVYRYILLAKGREDKGYHKRSCSIGL